MAVQQSTRGGARPGSGRKRKPRFVCADCGRIILKERLRCGYCERKLLPRTIRKQRPSCAQCGRVCRLRNKYCSSVCCGLAQRRTIHTCVIYGKTFRPKHGNVACSRTCGWKLQSRQAQEKREREWIEVLRLLPILVWFWRQPNALCGVCGQPYRKKQSSAVCSYQCLKKRQAIHREAMVRLQTGNRQRTCSECGKAFDNPYGWGVSRTVCSKRCANRRMRRQGQSHGKSHTARARSRGSLADPTIRRVDIFERDQWKCQLCGRTTPRRLLKDYRSLQAPTLDHIVPLSIGGSHTVENLQCACRSCNSRKGAKPLGQLRIF